MLFGLSTCYTSPRSCSCVGINEGNSASALQVLAWACCLNCCWLMPWLSENKLISPTHLKLNTSFKKLRGNACKLAQVHEAFLCIAAANSAFLENNALAASTGSTAQLLSPRRHAPITPLPPSLTIGPHYVCVWNARTPKNIHDRLSPLSSGQLLSPHEGSP